MSTEERKKFRMLEFQPPFIIVKSRRGLGLLDKLGSYSLTNRLGWLFTILMPIIAILGLYIVIRSVNLIISNALAREFIRSVTPLANLLIPGLNPYLPIVYGWIALIVGLVVHEGAHGVLARSLKFPVKSVGLLFFLVVPIGAFVEVDDKEIRAARARDSGRVLAAGPGSNMVVALASLLILLMMLGSASPVVDGIGVSTVVEGYPAYTAGIRPGDVLISVNYVNITKMADAYNVFSNLKPGDVVTLGFVRLSAGVVVGSYSAEVSVAANPYNSSRGYLGLGGVALREALDNYRNAWSFNPFIYLVWPTFSTSNQELIPFSDLMIRFYKSPLGPILPVLANVFFWIWFVNFNLSIFNALPIYPLDGGQTFRALLQGALRNVASEAFVKRLTLGVTFIVLGLVLSMLFFPYLLFQ
ncbi:MAG: site-2 protease family protein [Nitrososphaerales archaeon]